MQTPLLVIDGLSRRFGDNQALDGASFALDGGELLALLGPNGAGKSTLVRSIVGRARLDGGHIRLGGTVLVGEGLEPAAADLARRRIGLVPQDLALYPTMGPRENLRLFGRLAGLTGAELGERIDWGLELSGLKERANERVETFSGGMKRRLNIACGVLNHPDLILLDEPTVGVDPQSRQRIWQMLSELQHAGAGLLLTTHQLDEAQQLADRIVIIDHGKTVASGRFDELLEATVGRSYRMRLHVRGDTPPPAGFSADGLGRWVRPIADLDTALPAAILEVEATGVEIDDLEVLRPSLQEVFLHLTGHELREEPWAR